MDIEAPGGPCPPHGSCSHLRALFRGAGEGFFFRSVSAGYPTSAPSLPRSWRTSPVMRRRLQEYQRDMCTHLALWPGKGSSVLWRQIAGPTPAAITEAGAREGTCRRSWRSFPCSHLYGSHLYGSHLYGSHLYGSHLRARTSAPRDTGRASCFPPHPQYQETAMSRYPHPFSHGLSVRPPAHLSPTEGPTSRPTIHVVSPGPRWALRSSSRSLAAARPSGRRSPKLRSGA